MRSAHRSAELDEADAPTGRRRLARSAAFDGSRAGVLLAQAKLPDHRVRPTKPGDLRRLGRDYSTIAVSVGGARASDRERLPARGATALAASPCGWALRASKETDVAGRASSWSPTFAASRCGDAMLARKSVAAVMSANNVDAACAARTDGAGWLRLPVSRSPAMNSANSSVTSAVDNRDRAVQRCITPSLHQMSIPYPAPVVCP